MDYSSDQAKEYAARRDINREVLASLVDEAIIRERSRVVEAGCGSCNYLRALKQLTGCSVAGFDPSEGMLHEARRRDGLDLKPGKAEEIAQLYPAGGNDLVFSVDVIHHVDDVPRYFSGAYEVLRKGGRICTVTDSHEIIRRRRPLSEYWPETVPHELNRYPSIDSLQSSLREAGFSDRFTLTVSRKYRLTSAESYEHKVFSSLHLISPEEFRRGLTRLRSDLDRAPIIANSSYVLLWGTKT